MSPINLHRHSCRGHGHDAKQFARFAFRPSERTNFVYSISKNLSCNCPPSPDTAGLLHQKLHLRASTYDCRTGRRRPQSGSGSHCPTAQTKRCSRVHSILHRSRQCRDSATLSSVKMRAWERTRVTVWVSTSYQEQSVTFAFARTPCFSLQGVHSLRLYPHSLAPRLIKPFSRPAMHAKMPPFWPHRCWRGAPGRHSAAPAAPLQSRARNSRTWPPCRPGQA